MVAELINANPVVYEKKTRRVHKLPTVIDEYAQEPIDRQEIFGARFDFELAEELKEVVSDEEVKTALANKISRERIGHEVDLMMSDKQPSKAMAYIHDLKLFYAVFTFPENPQPAVTEQCDRLEKLGALEWNKVVHQHQGWRLVTCIWLHAGVIHLLANMLSLVFIGIRLEQQFGFIRIGAIYLLSGFGGSILSSLFIRNSISVGASGALFGLLGAMLSELFTNWTIYTNKAVALLTLLTIIAINLALGILPHVDNFAHIGGFLTGFLLGFILLMRPQFGWSTRHNLPPGSEAKSKYMAYQCILWALALILSIAGFVGGLVLLFRGVNVNEHCHWCHYLSCVPTSRWSCGN